MLEFIPKKYLERGMITSMLDEDRPVIESYRYKNRIHTVAYLQGFPIPLNIYIYSFLRRTIINRGEDYNNHHFDVDKLESFWNSIVLPRTAHDRFHQEVLDTSNIFDSMDSTNLVWTKKPIRVSDILRGSIDRIFEAADAPKIVSTSVQDNAKIKELIARFESDYEYSLANLIHLHSPSDSTSTTTEESSISSETKASI